MPHHQMNVEICFETTDELVVAAKALTKEGFTFREFRKSCSDSEHWLFASIDTELSAEAVTSWANAIIGRDSFVVEVDRFFEKAQAAILDIEKFEAKAKEDNGGRTYKSRAELFPSGRELYYEGKNRKAFIAEMKSKFDFDPSRDHGWSKGSGWRFHCPPDLLDKIYGRYQLGS